MALLQLPKFATGTYNKFPGSNYAHPKPFRNWTDTQMTAAIGGWLSTDPPGLELATLAYEELKSRGSDLHAGMKFADAGLPPIPWLVEAGNAVRKAFTTDVLDTQKTGRLGANVYVILRYGIEPLWSLFHFINPVPRARNGREAWETRLHEVLAQTIPKVTGDVAF